MRDRGAVDGAEAGLAAGVAVLDGAVEALVVGDGQGVHAQLGGAGGEGLGGGGAVEEGEVGVGVELGVHGGGLVGGLLIVNDSTDVLIRGLGWSRARAIMGRTREGVGRVSGHAAAEVMARWRIMVAEEALPEGMAAEAGRRRL